MSRARAAAADECTMVMAVPPEYATKGISFSLVANDKISGTLRRLLDKVHRQSFATCEADIRETIAITPERHPSSIH